MSSEIPGSSHIAERRDTGKRGTVLGRHFDAVWDYNDGRQIQDVVSASATKRNILVESPELRAELAKALSSLHDKEDSLQHGPDTYAVSDVVVDGQRYRVTMLDIEGSLVVNVAFDYTDGRTYTSSVLVTNFDTKNDETTAAVQKRISGYEVGTCVSIKGFSSLGRTQEDVKAGSYEYFGGDDTLDRGYSFERDRDAADKLQKLNAFTLDEIFGLTQGEEKKKLELDSFLEKNRHMPIFCYFN
ncbi:MAG: hypothetical protein UV82_C0010G0023 [Candidatus Magasanikbacteria bacterium GW2011_GWD2_43_18]|uniref:Uncharacterized protein n=1 Tax=Candidatus Magasanikbacteria bacterium GW2011_GWE2_42_7 TaxID=1619052 RepID=A0A0G1EB16_9BACT|nr:MAG: hypothetical protein UV18_C0005G0161 [Candidatus Magasanikbacteria bacterium GW2011_GWC2_42_27]KKS71788.1 MAG: hypothetical protein UV42_C0019G0012 [Candidatus Magasanikbacteria bacterium GW2011_GWE2_42_7]KKT04207.1 MAG: hypothetical protein UV82_C0010G0023 [Candidatus Magasanikbacteria bacterium GW2011_GWD2_43_18]KKT25901.1 MAG: hypothetical protein UW10_C0003G0062 [Candidatus Magasanikbacteria bacterium GW2011_GWA2_43_9]HBB37878.1 hypothetical protein [Candidatus Magasanikbacteria bac